MNVPTHAIRFVRVLLTVLLTASITVVGSERMFWFWSPGLTEHLVLVAFYSIPAGATLWAIDRFGVHGLWSLLLATPIYAYITEGLITPILYMGGPFVPFFPAWFAAWHGMLAFVLLWYVVRRLLLAEAWKPLLLVAVGSGVFWGLWSSTLRLPENVNDPELVAELGELTALGPGAFFAYVAKFTVVLGTSHWLLGIVWPRRFVVPRWSARVVGGVIVTGVIAWTFAVLWAAPMFAAYMALQWWGLRRHSRRGGTAGGDLFERLAGRVRVRAFWPLAACVPAAGGTYWALWSLDPSDDVLAIVFYSIIGLQALVGAVATVVALRRSAGPRGRGGEDPSAFGSPGSAGELVGVAEIL